MMRVTVALAIIFSIPYLMFGQTTRTCGINDILEHTLESNPTTYQDFIELNEGSAAHTRNEILLPVVVHIIYSNEHYNISDFQIISQVEALNEGFEGAFELSDDIIPAHRDKISGSNIRFRLACQDPGGNPTNGITRTQTTIPDIGFHFDPSGVYAVHHTEFGGQDPWPTSDYINIWVAEMDNQLLGRSSVPLPLNDPYRDGVVINTNFFGYAGLAYQKTPYDLGRTLIHEIGHYFGLLHPWGQGQGNCINGDGVDDTPDQSEIYYDCPSEAESISCGSPDMTKNFMGYADDACLQYFTSGQVNRMMTVLNGYRASLLASSGAINCGLQDNTEERITFWNRVDLREWVLRFPTQQQSIQTEIFNMKGALIKKFTVANTDLVHISMRSFPAGMYIVRFTYENQSEQRVIALF